MTNPTRTRLQFSLRKLFALVALASVSFAAIAAFGALGLCGIWLATAIGLLASGMYRGRRGQTVAGALLLVALGISFIPLTTIAVWTGRSVQLVTISVVDAQASQPIDGAQVEIFVDEGGPVLSTGQTDRQGRAVLTTEFRAGGRSGLLEETGSIIVFGTVVSADAPGYHRAERWLHETTGNAPDLYGGPFPITTIRLPRSN